MKYQSEIIKEIIDERGHKKSSIHYESECIETMIEEDKGAYPKLCDYEGEWLYYINEKPIGEFPYAALNDVTEATIENVVPYAYKSATLKGKSETVDGTLQSVKMPVLMTTGKNLLDPNTVELVIESSNSAQTITYDAATGIYEFLCPKSSNQMNIKFKNLYGITSPQQVYISGTCDSSGATYEVGRAISVNDNVIGIQIVHNWKPVTKANLKIMITVDNNAITAAYEPFKSNILTVNEELELRGIGDAKDELNCLTGEVVERIKERVFNGSENWTVNGQDADGTYRYICGKYTDAKSSSVNVICDKIGFADVNSDINIIKTTSTGKIQIATTKTLNELKGWLAQNPITIQYELATESIKTVDLTVSNQNGDTCQLKPIEGTMHLEASSDTIQPSFSGEIPVEATTQNLASFIEE